MIRTFDMFSGGGGSSWGAAMAGASVIGGVDAWTLATEVFADNFPDAKVFNGRVEELEPGVILDEIGPVHLLLASPECTSHSCARGARPRLESSRETAFQVVRYARVMRPRWIIIENVIHMRPWSRYQSLLQTLRDEGYRVAEHVLDAADHGLAQRRKRLFLLCDRECEPPARIPKRRGPKRSAASILDRSGTWKRSPLDNGRRAAATLERAERGFSALGREVPFLIVYYGSDGAGGWQPLTVPLRTITTLDRFGLCEPSDDGPTLRMLQVPELARAMGFNDELILKRGTRRDRVMLMGNGVCPPVMEAAVKALVGREQSDAQRDEFVDWSPMRHPFDAAREVDRPDYKHGSNPKAPSVGPMSPPIERAVRSVV
ncbi:MAG: DNA cytosine methyltransferase [Bryobacterales bacterium]|nr:DNA cytosine methyltransferase [Bryobacterales bacterium]